MGRRNIYPGVQENHDLPTPLHTYFGQLRKQSRVAFVKNMNAARFNNLFKNSTEVLYLPT